MFKSLIERGVAKETGYIYMIDNQGHQVYEIESGFVKLFIQELKKQKQLVIRRDKKEKVWVLFWKDMFGTEHFAGVFQ